MKKVSIDALIKQLQAELDELDLSLLKASTIFLEIEGWNSLYSLVLMAFISTEYNLDLPAEEISRIRTVADLQTAINNSIT